MSFDMPDKVFVYFGDDKKAQVHTDFRIYGDAQYTRTDLAQSLAHALEHLLVSDRYEAIAQARAALANYRKGE